MKVTLPLEKVLMQAGKEVKFEWPTPLRKPTNERDMGKFCDHHRDHGHNTEHAEISVISWNQWYGLADYRNFLNLRTASRRRLSLGHRQPPSCHRSDFLFQDKVRDSIGSDAMRSQGSCTIFIYRS